MNRNVLRSLALAAAAAAASPTLAHEVRCEKEVGLVVPLEGGVYEFLAPPGDAFVLEYYPALVGFRVRVSNLAAEPSTLTAVSDTLTDGLAGAITLGDELVGNPIAVGGALERVILVPVASYEACLALGGEETVLACRESALENRFVATHDAGSAECRARLVCAPPGTPPQ